MIALPLMLTAALLLGQAPAEKSMPPLTAEQSTRLRELVRSTQETSATLQAQLDDKQKALAALFAEYDLKERDARKFEDEIIELQKQLLNNHHRLQTELRTIVGKERFDVLRQRVNRIVPAPGQKDAPK